jgi:hypothetical protein
MCGEAAWHGVELCGAHDTFSAALQILLFSLRLLIPFFSHCLSCQLFFLLFIASPKLQRHPDDQNTRKRASMK